MAARPKRSLTHELAPRRATTSGLSDRPICGRATTAACQCEPRSCDVRLPARAGEGSGRKRLSAGVELVATRALGRRSALERLERQPDHRQEERDLDERDVDPDEQAGDDRDLEADDDRHDRPADPTRTAGTAGEEKPREPDEEDVRQDALDLVAEDVEGEIREALDVDDLADALEQEDPSEGTARDSADHGHPAG